MRQDLDDLLCARHPALYAERNLGPDKSCMAWGFPGDGWFAILDAVSEVLTLDAASCGRPLDPAQQVAEAIRIESSLPHQAPGPVPPPQASPERRAGARRSAGSGGFPPGVCGLPASRRRRCRRAILAGVQ
jgi:hypothetical protein